MHAHMNKTRSKPDHFAEYGFLRKVMSVERDHVDAGPSWLVCFRILGSAFVDFVSMR